MVVRRSRLSRSAVALAPFWAATAAARGEDPGADAPPPPPSYQTIPAPGTRDSGWPADAAIEAAVERAVARVLARLPQSPPAGPQPQVAGVGPVPVVPSAQVPPVAAPVLPSAQAPAQVAVVGQVVAPQVAVVGQVAGRVVVPVQLGPGPLRRCLGKLGACLTRAGQPRVTYLPLAQPQPCAPAAVAAPAVLATPQQR